MQPHPYLPTLNPSPLENYYIENLAEFSGSKDIYPLNLQSIISSSLEKSTKRNAPTK